MGRDDIASLPLSRRAKAYARRHGIASMKRQPKDFLAVNAELTNPGKPDKFKNYDVGVSLGNPRSGIKESRTKTLVDTYFSAKNKRKHS